MLEELVGADERSFDRQRGGVVEIEKTGRGFEFIAFEDRNGKRCSVQQSSIADYEPPGSSALWVGLDGHEERHSVTGEPLGCRMHIDLKLAKELIRHLAAWVKTGSLETTHKKRKGGE